VRKNVKAIAVPFGTLLAIIGCWSVWIELGRPVQYIGAVEIGGPEPQAVFGSAVLALIGVAAVAGGATRKT